MYVCNLHILEIEIALFRIFSLLLTEFLISYKALKQSFLKIIDQFGFKNKTCVLIVK